MMTQDFDFSKSNLFSITRKSQRPQRYQFDIN